SARRSGDPARRRHADRRARDRRRRRRLGVRGLDRELPAGRRQGARRDGTWARRRRGGARRGEGGGAMIAILIVLGFTAVVVLLSPTWVVKNLLFVSAPNEALISSGARRVAELGEGQGKEVGFRVIRGGRGIRVPLLERVDRLDLSNLPIEVGVR